MSTKPAAIPQKNTSTHPASVLLGKFGLIIAVILLLLAAWAGQTVVVILLGLSLAAVGLSKLWSYYSLRGVHSERHLTENRTFPEGTLELKIKLINRKLLPLPWVEVTDEVPAGFIAETDLEPATRPGFELISRSASLMWYSAATWKYSLLCKRRGYYHLGPLSVTSGDIFGLYPRTAIEPVEDNIVVYPRIFNVSNIAIPSLYPLGEAKSKKLIFEDPLRLIGIRDYSPGDSLRRIHWKASARHQQLQVKVFEPTTSLKVSIFLAIDSFQNNGVWNYADMELGISSAASLASYLIEKRSQVGLRINSNLADSGLAARINLRGGVDQLVQILEALAKVTAVPSASFMEFLQNERQDLPLGTTLVFIFQQMPEKFPEILTDLRGSGYKILAFQVGEAKTDCALMEVDWYSVQPPGEFIEISHQEN